MDNLRQTFRVPGEGELDAVLRHGLLAARCQIENVSAGGARVRVRMDHVLDPGTTCRLELALAGRDRRGAAAPGTTVEIACEVIQALALADGWVDMRLRSLERAGSPGHEQVAHLVREAQRRMLARRSGVDEAAPMASDAERRTKLREERRARFGKGSLRPGGDT